MLWSPKASAALFSNFSAVRDSSVTGVADDTLIIYSTAA
jgi:hypothetical protein